MWIYLGYVVFLGVVCCEIYGRGVYVVISILKRNNVEGFCV